MGDLWQDEGFGGPGALEEGDDDWDEGEEELDTSLEGLDDPDDLEDDDSAWDDESDDA